MGILRVRVVPQGHAQEVQHIAPELRSNSAPAPSQQHQVPSPRHRALVISHIGQKVCEASAELVDSLSNDNVTDVRWYFEVYPVRDTFAVLRARSIRRKLINHAKLLIKDFFPAEIFASIRHADQLLVEIHDAAPESNQSAHFFSQLYWELLEDTDLWQDALDCVLANVYVVRASPSIPYDDLEVLEAQSPSVQKKELRRHVLAVTARPSMTDDIPYRLITRSILATVEQIPLQHDANPTFDIARPATIASLIQHLETRGAGHYDVLHLDVHGFVEDGEGYLVMIKFDAQMKIHPDYISASRLALLASEYRIDTVVINACRSAAAYAASNIARLLVKEGIKVAVGMSFDVLSSTAEKFMARFYELFLGRGVPVIHAVAGARQTLRQSTVRATQMGNTVELEDFMIPIVHCRQVSGSDLTYLDFDGNYKQKTSTDESLVRPSFAGREGEMLLLESYITQERISVHLTGEPGIGKTALLKEAAAWWQTTGLERRVIYLDFAEFATARLTMNDLVSKIAQLIDSSEECSISTLPLELNNHNAILILDSVEVVRWLTDQPPAIYEGQFRRFLRQLKKCSVIVAAREIPAWVGSGFQLKLRLESLDLTTSVALGMSFLRASVDIKLALASQEELQVFEQFILLSNGNPLATKLMSLDLAFHLSGKDSFTITSYITELLQLRTIEINPVLLNDSSRSLRDIFAKFHDATPTFAESDNGIIQVLNWESRRDETGDTSSLVDLLCDMAPQNAPNSAPANKSTTLVARRPGSDSTPSSMFLTPYDADRLIFLSTMAFWGKLPSNLEPFFTGLVSFDLGRRYLSQKDFARFRRTMLNLIERSQETSQPLRTIMVSSWPENRPESRLTAKYLSSVSLRVAGRAEVLLQGPLLEYFSDKSTQIFATEGTELSISYYAVSPILTLAAGSSLMRAQHPPDFIENLEMARYALYSYHHSRWLSLRALPSLPAFDIMRQELAYDFFNHLSITISTQKIGSWPYSDEWATQYLVWATKHANFGRLSLITNVLERFLGEALAYVRVVREKHYDVDKNAYKSSAMNLDEWNIGCALEFTCLTLISKIMTCQQELLRSHESLLKAWRFLGSKPMIPHDMGVSKSLRDTFSAGVALFTSQVRLMASPSTMVSGRDALIQTRKQSLESLRSLWATELGLDISVDDIVAESTRDAYEYLVRRSIEDNWGQDSVRGKLWRIETRLNDGQDNETRFEIIAELEELLANEIRNSTSPAIMIYIYNVLSTTHRLVGNHALAAQCLTKRDEILSVLGPIASAEVNKKNTFVIDYRILRLEKRAGENMLQRLEKRLGKQRRELEVLEQETPVRREAVLELLSQISDTLRDLGRHEEAIPIYRLEIEGRRKYFAAEDDSLLPIFFALGKALDYVGQHDEALHLAYKIRDAYKRLNGPHDQTYLNAAGTLGLRLFNRASSYKADSDQVQRDLLMAEAETLLLEVLHGEQELAEQTGKPNPLGRNNLASFYAHCGENEKAEKLYREAISTETALTNNVYDRSFLRAKNNLAVLLAQQGRTEEATTLYREVFNRRMEHYGPRHADTLHAMGQLCRHLAKMEGEVAAHTFADNFATEFKAAVDGDIGALDKNALDLDQANYGLAVELLSCGEYKSSLKIFESVCTRLRERPDQKRLLSNALKNLSLCSSNLKPPRWRQALDARNEELEHRVQLDGKEHSDTQQCLSGRVVCSRSLGFLHDAERFQQEAIRIVARVQGEQSSRVLEMTRYLGLIQVEQEKLKEAGETYLRVYQLQKSISPGSALHAGAASRLGAHFFDSKKWESAAAYRREALAIWLQTKESSEVNTLIEMRELGRSLSMSGCHEEARNILQSVVDRFAALQEEKDNLEFFATKCYLIEAVYQEERDTEAGEKALVQILTEWKETKQENLVESMVYFKIAGIYERAEDYKRALHFRRQSLVARKALPGTHVMSVADQLKQLAETCDLAREWGECERTLRERLRLLDESEPGKASMGIVKSLRLLVKCLLEQGAAGKASEWQECTQFACKAVEMIQLLRGPDDEMTAEYRNWRDGVLAQPKAHSGPRLQLRSRTRSSPQ